MGDKGAVNPRNYPSIENQGYAIERHIGQTAICLPPAEKLQVPLSELERLAIEVFAPSPKTWTSISTGYDGIQIDMPSVKSEPTMWAQTEEENEKITKQFNQDPSIIFPNWYLPEKLIKKIYEISPLPVPDHLKKIC